MACPLRFKRTLQFCINGGPNFLNGSPSSLNGSPSSLNGSPTFLNGSLSVLNGSLSFLNGSLSFLNGSPSFLNGSLSVLNGSPSFLNGSPSFLNGSPSVVKESGDYDPEMRQVRRLNRIIFTIFKYLFYGYVLSEKSDVPIYQKLTGPEKCLNSFFSVFRLFITVNPNSVIQ